MATSYSYMYMHTLSCEFINKKDMHLNVLSTDNLILKTYLIIATGWAPMLYWPGAHHTRGFIGWEGREEGDFQGYYCITGMYSYVK